MDRLLVMLYILTAQCATAPIEVGQCYSPVTGNQSGPLKVISLRGYTMCYVQDGESVRAMDTWLLNLLYDRSVCNE